MFSEALAILDRNTERYMIKEMNQEIREKKQEITEKNQEITDKNQEIHKLKDMNAEKDEMIKAYRAKMIELGINPDEI